MLVGYIALSLLAVCPVLGDEWDCAATNGTFNRSTGCTMTGEVSVSGDLTVTGKETVYSTLTAASGSRHFKIDGGAHTLKLKWMNMTGGNVGTCDSDICYGGSIYVYNVAAHLNISHCVFSNNRAYRGGAVYAKDQNPVLVFNHVLSRFNFASYRGGVLFLEKATYQGSRNTFSENVLEDWGGGAMWVARGSVVSSTDSSFIKNNAWHGGGAICVFGSFSDPADVKLIRASIIENEQTVSSPNGAHGGGGLYLEGGSVVQIRECAFVRNKATGESNGVKHGHQILSNTHSTLGNPGNPSITVL